MLTQSNTSKGYLSLSNSLTPILIAIFLLIGFEIFLSSILLLRWYQRNRGVYLTEEGDKLIERAENTDDKKREKFTTLLPQVEEVSDIDLYI